MNELNVRKQQRQQTLVRLVAERRLATQQDVVRALRAAGYAATQATVSRDIVELGLVKVARDGTHVLPHSAVHGLPVTIASVTAEAGSTM